MAAVLAFAMAQVLASAHSAKYGDGPHDHGGQACVLSLAAPGGDKFVAASVFVFAVVFAIWRIAKQNTRYQHAPVLVRAAQSRGPPSL